MAWRRSSTDADACAGATSWLVFRVAPTRRIALRTASPCERGGVSTTARRVIAIGRRRSSIDVYVVCRRHLLAGILHRGPRRIALRTGSPCEHGGVAPVSSNDMRTLLASSDPRARYAVDLFVWRSAASSARWPRCSARVGIQRGLVRLSLARSVPGCATPVAA
jgi:hypothetical protein